VKIHVAKLLLMMSFAVCSACGHHDNHGFDPTADPFAQVNQAKTDALASHRKILVVAGGAWCHWCRALDNFIRENGDISSRFHNAFVIVKVYSGDEKDNQLFFKTLPEAPGVPHFWVLNEKGELLKSQGTDAFETGKDRYSKDKLVQFANEWITKK
jgi:thioredoxin-related protein